jgi:hypothetical protein
LWEDEKHDFLEVVRREKVLQDASKNGKESKRSRLCVNLRRRRVGKCKERKVGVEQVQQQAFA